MVQSEGLPQHITDREEKRGSVSRALVENRRAGINSLADQVDKFYADFKGRCFPTYVLTGRSGKNIGRDFLEPIVVELENRSVPGVNSHKYSCQIVAESQLVNYLVSGFTYPEYKLKIDVVLRPEGGRLE